jgi:hypothetical protein
MLFHSYLRLEIVYIPTVVKVQTGAYMDVEPVAVVSVANTEGLRRAFFEAIGRKNAIVPNPPKGSWPPPVLLKYAGLKTWSAFARNACQWSIEADNGLYQIVGYREHPDGYWVQDSNQKTEFSPRTPVDGVVERMIAILQEAALK